MLNDDYRNDADKKLDEDWNESEVNTYSWNGADEDGILNSSVWETESREAESNKEAESTGKIESTIETQYIAEREIYISKKHKRKGFLTRGIAFICFTALCVSAGYIWGNFPGTNAADNSSAVSDSIAPSSTDGNKQVYTPANASINPDGKVYTIAEVADMAAKSVVEIITETVTNGNYLRQYVSQGAGSGVIISEDGYIITNDHVIDGASNITVKLKNDDKEYKATLVGTDAKTDIAIIKIEAEGLQPAIFGDSSALIVGQEVVAIGNPLGSLGGTVTNGIISALDREIEIEGEAMTLLQTNAAINPGNSGGGLFNLSGELVGVVNAKSSGSDIEGLGFAIPANTAKEVAEDLMNHGYVKGRIGLGMSLIDITNNQTAMMYRVNRLGLYVLKVDNSGSAKNAGIESGDCIISVDGKEIKSYSDFTKIIDEHKIGDTLSIVVYRNTQEITCNITLQEYKP